MRKRSKERPYFPLFLDLSNRKIVVVGGGRIACRRVRTLLPFVNDLTLVAPEVLPELEELACSGRIRWIAQPYRRDLIQHAEMVLACTDDTGVNNEIYLVCRRRGILVNVCSSREKCDFYFPGIVKKDELVVGITADGRDHKRVKEVRKKVEELLEEESFEKKVCDRQPGKRPCSGTEPDGIGLCEGTLSGIGAGAADHEDDRR